MTELKESTPINVQMADYEKKTEYVVSFETKGDDAKETKTEEVSVVHDKVTHHTEIIAVEPVVEQQPTETETKEGHKEHKEHKDHKSEESHEYVPEEKFTVVDEHAPEVPIQVHEAIKKIAEEVRVSEHIPEKEMQVKEVLIREHDENTKVEKVQEVIENTKTGEQLLVTAIINSETSKVVVEDVKPIES